VGLKLRLGRNGDCSRRLKHRPSNTQLLCQIGGQPFYAGRPFAGHDNNGFVADSKVSEICAHDSIAYTSFSPGGRIIGSVKSYLRNIANGSWHSGEPDKCARAGTVVLGGRRWTYPFFVSDRRSARRNLRCRLSS
jgi:hypothetical protein